MSKKKIIRAISMLVCGAVAVSCVPTLAGCSGKKDSIVLMTEELSGLFNPFYATSGTDMDVVGMTQIGMLSTDRNGNPVAGDDEATVVKAFSVDSAADMNGKSVYTFVIKNGLKFSDGKPLTMNDVLFNMYEYLDPVYTGSSTMYSVDIVGLSQYRTQTNYSSGTDDTESAISASAMANARMRRNELIDIYESNSRVEGNPNAFYDRTEAEMKEFIRNYTVSEGYKDAVATESQKANLTNADYQDMLIEDYDFVLKTFKEELESDFKAAKESYDTNSLPYSEWKDKLNNDVFKFFLYEGYIQPKYEQVNGRDNKSKILSFENESIINVFPTQEQAIARVYSDNVKQFNKILTAWGTAGTVVTKYAADATEVIIRNNMSGSSLLHPNISGIVSLGHTTNQSSVTIDNVTYNVAHSHNQDGTPVNPNEYDVLQVSVNGIDPKAIYNFGFSVAPAHYYSADEEHPNGREIDIVNNKFGVEFASSTFQSKVIQSQQHVEIPVGAGAYMATNKDNSDNPAGSEFWSSNIIYYKANRNFMFDVKTEKVRMQVVSPSDALDKLEANEVDYVVPQFTKTNADRLKTMTQNGYGKLDSWQLGYGYIGINAGKVKNINIRRAIMAAMQTSLACEYYSTGTCEPINWPMSNVSWAYPWQDENKTQSYPNGHDYTQWQSPTDAISKIRKYMDYAGVSAGDSQLKITFTIAGASITEHPTYEVFKQAAEILNKEGWNVEVKADSQALTKLATGSLAVWAAAWGSTIDPDMYQVYHKDSKATSVYAWGYREILEAPNLYPEETRIITELSDLIDDGREIDSSTDEGKNQRRTIYREAMGKVLDLAVELPVYQRKNLYAYNAKTVKGFPSTVNHYSSPLEKIWELELIG